MASDPVPNFPLFAEWAQSGLTRRVEWVGWAANEKSARKSVIRVRFAGMQDLPVEFDIAHGYGLKTVADWHLTDAAALRGWADGMCGRVISERPRPIRAERVRRARRGDAKQLMLGGIVDGSTEP